MKNNLGDSMPVALIRSCAIDSANARMPSAHTAKSADSAEREGKPFSSFFLCQDVAETTSDGLRVPHKDPDSDDRFDPDEDPDLNGLAMEAAASSFVSPSDSLESDAPQTNHRLAFGDNLAGRPDSPDGEGIAQLASDASSGKSPNPEAAQRTEDITATSTLSRPETGLTSGDESEALGDQFKQHLARQENLISRPDPGVGILYASETTIAPFSREVAEQVSRTAFPSTDVRTGTPSENFSAFSHMALSGLPEKLTHHDREGPAPQFDLAGAAEAKTPQERQADQAKAALMPNPGSETDLPDTRSPLQPAMSTLVRDVSASPGKFAATQIADAKDSIAAPKAGTKTETSGEEQPSTVLGNTKDGDPSRIDPTMHRAEPRQSASDQMVSVRAITDNKHGIEGIHPKSVATPPYELTLNIRPDTVSATHSASHPVDLRNGFPIHISEHIHRHPGDQIEIALAPAELGKLKLALHLAESSVTVHISSDRPETLDLARHNVTRLAADLQSLGYENISFAFSGDGGRGSRHLPQTKPPSGTDTEEPPAPGFAEQLSANNVARQPEMRNANLDMRI